MTHVTQAICVFDPNSSFNKTKIKGTISFSQPSPDYMTLITFNLYGLPPNTTRGCHIHESGDLTKGCESGCAHFRIPDTMHGSIQLYGSSRHLGDMMNNITSDKNGNVSFSYYDDLVDLTGPYSVIGRMIVIHADKDDLGEYRYEDSKRGEGSRTTGNAGKRIACSLIGITKDNLCS